jgi:hypothetical protein
MPDAKEGLPTTTQPPAANLHSTPNQPASCPAKGTLPPASDGTPSLSSSSSVQLLESEAQRPGVILAATNFGNPEFDIEPPTLTENIFRHSGWAARRHQVFGALQRTCARPRNLQLFANCGSCLFAKVSSTKDDFKLCANHCHSRWCVPCANSRAATIAHNVRDILHRHPARFITLTLRHSHNTLADQLSRLFTCFTQMRRREAWKSAIRGGAAFIELKISERDGLWHVHLHILAETPWFDQKTLSREWYAVTGDSSIVDIRPIPNHDHVARYVTKYVTKPADSSVFATPGKLDEMIVALRGRHLCFTFGAWHKLKLAHVPATDKDWQPLGRVDTIFRAAANGDPLAQRWMESLLRKWPSLAIFQVCPNAGTPLPVDTS